MPPTNISHVRSYVTYMTTHLIGGLVTAACYAHFSPTFVGTSRSRCHNFIKIHLVH